MCVDLVVVVGVGRVPGLAVTILVYSRFYPFFSNPFGREYMIYFLTHGLVCYVSVFLFDEITILIVFFFSSLFFFCLLVIRSGRAKWQNVTLYWPAGQKCYKMQNHEATIPRAMTAHPSVVVTFVSTVRAEEISFSFGRPFGVFRSFICVFTYFLILCFGLKASLKEHWLC